MHRPGHPLPLVYCTADDLLPERKRNARRETRDAEIVTLAWLGAHRASPLTAASFGRRRQIGHLFPDLPAQDAFHKRRGVFLQIEWLFGVFCSKSPAQMTTCLLLDSAHRVRVRWRPRAARLLRRSPDMDTPAVIPAGSGMPTASSLRPDGTPRAVQLAPANAKEKWRSPVRPSLKGGETIVCDKATLAGTCREGPPSWVGPSCRPTRAVRRPRSHSLLSANGSNRFLDLQRRTFARASRRPHSQKPGGAHLVGSWPCACIYSIISWSSQRALVDYTS